MKNNFKKFISIGLALVMMISVLSLSVYATAPYNDYNAEESGIATIDGITYKVEETHLDNKEITIITNLTDNTQDIIYFDQAKGTVF